MPPCADVIGQRLQSFITADLIPSRSMGLQDELLLSGLIDSLAIMRLVAFVEVEFNIKVPPEDVTITNMTNIDAIATYVARLLDLTAAQSHEA